MINFKIQLTFGESLMYSRKRIGFKIDPHGIPHSNFDDEMEKSSEDFI